MKKTVLIWIGVLGFFLAVGQENMVEDPQFDKKISSLLEFSVPLWSVFDLRNTQNEVILFDVRKRKEYTVSHIQNAIHLGYPNLNLNVLQDLDMEKDTLVLYCSIGYRSEKAGKKLKAMGFKNVYNLYGSIFEWANMGFPLVDLNNKRTDKLHVYSKSWGSWVKNPEINKIWK